MIRGFRHKGLARLYYHAERKGLSAELIPKIERVLARLDVSGSPEALNLPGWRLHPLKGDRHGMWSVSVAGNWRIIFRFHGADVTDVELVDYH